jgi:hypothetical protein
MFMRWILPAVCMSLGEAGLVLSDFEHLDAYVHKMTTSTSSALCQHMWG